MTIQRVHVVTAATAIVALGFLSLALLDTIAAQGRPSSIQTAGGGKGPGAAPEANDPANAKADLSPRPPSPPARTRGTSEAVLAARRVSNGEQSCRIP